MRQLLSAVSEMGLLKQLASAVFWKTETTQRIDMLIDLNFEDSKLPAVPRGRERIPALRMGYGRRRNRGGVHPLQLALPDAVLVAVGCRLVARRGKRVLASG